MSSTLQQKINELERRLKLENKSRDHDRTKPMVMGNDFPISRPPKAESGHPSPARRPRPGLGEIGTAFSRPSSAPPPGRRRPAANLDLGGSRAPRQYDGAEIEQKYQDIMKMTQILTFYGQKYQADIAELEARGDLGHGTCGQVVKMEHKSTGHLMAVKQMRRSGNKEENKRIIMDLEVVLKCTDYPYIVQCIGCFITASEVWICMELMSTCLDKLLKRTKTPIPERILGKMAVAIVKALNYLKEEHGVIHRDVKPSNILLDENGTVKLCDFGISGRLVDSKAKTRSAGCAAYMAPERIDPPDPQRPDYDIRADVWSLGITLVELATGEFPYKNCKTDFEVLTKVLQEDPPLLPPSREFSHEFCSFVRDCLTKDYKKRPKYKKLLEHVFIKKYEREDVDVAAWFSEVSKVMAKFEPS
ncbi:dual specificity mitogen-activated protein kinase kinase 7-like [Mytilus galloprovincialis]|uniref:Dual specificity mitogen-activated protein kinase kinase 7 n=2 Tax=Mytilus TaxID=6548 RepID=A0A8S3QZM0_MYTED|nr:MAP kinase kinase 7-like protein [Mytilus edulis]